MKTAFLLVSAVFARCILGDVVECENGDRYNGKVLLVDEQNVKLQNEIAGVLNIPRAKVVTISFRPQKAAPQAGVRATGATNLSALALPQAIQGDPATIERVQNEILGTAGPEANQMFQEMVRGLLSGKLDATDIRSKAQSTLNDLKELQKELGDDDSAALLNTYAGILQGFVNQTPAKPTTNTARPPVSSPEKQQE
jgi:hypothetical protein